MLFVITSYSIHYTKLYEDYGNNGWLYFTYSGYAEDDKTSGCTNVMRARLSGNQLVDQEVIFNGTPDSDKGHHWGSKLEFDRKGHLFFGVGDRGNRDENPQSLTNHAGKIHRIMDDGSIPSDNPFVDTVITSYSIHYTKLYDFRDFFICQTFGEV